MDRSPISRLHFLVTTAQTLAPNDVTNERWPRLYLVYFVVIFIRKEEVMMCLLSLFVSLTGGKIVNKSAFANHFVRSLDMAA